LTGLQAQNNDPAGDETPSLFKAHKSIFSSLSITLTCAHTSIKPSF